MNHDPIEFLYMQLIAGLYEEQVNVINSTDDVGSKIEKLAAIELMRNNAFIAVGKWNTGPWG